MWCLFLFLLFSCTSNSSTTFSISTQQSENKPLNFGEKLALAAEGLVDPGIVYKADYVSIKYPMGDVPAGTGVCADVIIRAYRKLHIDLQKEIHEDMEKHFSVYPKIWGLKRPDAN